MANFHSFLYNHIDIYQVGGGFSWSKPGDLDGTKPILVHVWGAGGAGDDYYTYTTKTSNGGGGGGLAVKLIDASALGATEAVTIGLGNDNSNIAGGTSSFGSHCSATGGNGGACTAVNNGSNGGAVGTANYGIGGLGTGGDINRRGGSGGAGYYADTTNSGGGGGGSAPAPYGVSDGFNGGAGFTRAGGGGGGIGGAGNPGSDLGGTGGSSMRDSCRSVSPNSYFTPAPGASGLLGAGSSSGCNYLTYTTYGGTTARTGELPEGSAILTPNEICLGGGAGKGGLYYYTSSPRTLQMATSGGPGAGGGGLGSNTTTGTQCSPGHGGLLGGSGGGSQYGYGAIGGNAGGAGGTGYYSYGHPPRGGDGLVIIQYARLI